MQDAHTENEPTTKDPAAAPPTFGALGICDTSLAAIEAMGWDAPTPIQAQAIPPALEGRDLVGIAQTGTGKTGAFLLPALEKIEEGKGIQVLVLCPTRELASQVEEEARAMARGTSYRAAHIVGGVGYGPQIEALNRGDPIVVATPGRLNDHMENGRVDLRNVKVLVLDEADRMLDMGFREQIEEVLKRSSKERQTMLFSATMPQGVHALARRITRDPVWARVKGGGSVAEGIREEAYSVRPESKPDLLIHLLEQSGWDQVLVFTRTKDGADVLRNRLRRVGVSVDAMHSDRDMKHRREALERFARGDTRVLVATDIAQRGLDVEGISHVVNYDVPTDPEDYVHRIGRTGRAGAAGTAVTFVAAGDLGFVKSIEHRLERSLPRVSVPQFDYAGAPAEGKGGGSGSKRSRSASRMGSKRADDLSEEELQSLLGHKP